jgi:hypothetical protein
MIEPRGPDPLEVALFEAVAAMTRPGVRYALIGGLATGYRSRPRYTQDVDFLIECPQITLPSLLDDLHRKGFVFDQRAVIEEFTRQHLAVLWYEGVRVDWLKPVLPIYKHILDLAREEPGPTEPIRVVTTEGLILLKLMAFRLQDQTDIEALVAANRDTVDLEWIKKEWVSVASLDDPRMEWLVEQLGRA